MKWSVGYLPSGENDLAAVWMAFPSDRQTITDAALRIEQELERDPESKGEDFYGDRIFQYGPLAVVYVLFDDERTVKITQVMRIRETN
ncbi:MAG TPA: hypothetical protein VKI65_11920 [Gemmataceae bacterium]|nr:hypothetical protein [Gemmataceae bacterium]